MYFLMNKDVMIASFEIIGSGSLEACQEIQFHSKAPCWLGSLDSWLSDRSAAKHRAHVKKILETCGGMTLSGFIRLTHCLSLTDTLWVKSDRETVCWEDVSLYRNEFNEIISRLSFDGAGLFGEQMSTSSPELTTDGAYDKCWTGSGGEICLIKTGSAGARNAGLEPYGEVLASAVYETFCGDAVRYTLEHYHGRTVSRCRLFTSEQFGFKPFSLFVSQKPTVPQILEAYERAGSLDAFKRMIICDSVCLNMDRHIGNFGYLFDNDTFENIRLNPIFDFNMAFVPYAEAEDFADFDHYIAERGPAVGEDYYELPRAFMDSGIRADLINLKDLVLDVETDERYTAERVDAVNEIKNTQIDRLLGNRRQFDFHFAGRHPFCGGGI